SLVQIGHQIGMSNSDIYSILSPNFELLRSMIQENDPDLQKFKSVLKSTKPSSRQVEELVKEGMAKSPINTDFLGALAVQNIMTVMKAAEKYGGKKGVEAALSSLTGTGAGSGEDLLEQWFLHRHEIPSRFRNKIKEIARAILVDIGIKYSHAYLGSDIKGPLTENDVRPFTEGDDFDDVDLEETLEHLIQSGKKIEHVNHDDFFILRPSSGLRSIIIELDISGSMSGKKLSYMALCAVMCLHAFSPDEIALCFFESNTHVVKELDDNSVDLEQVADELLELTAKGGTVMHSAIKWAVESFEKKARSKMKMNILMTDAEIFDLEDCQEYLQRLQEFNVRFLIVVPKMNYHGSLAKKMVDITSGQLLTFRNWREFPKKISEILSER
ncbi:MAG: VWA domain-containing protein, partial [Candidatus Helarchaeota archaeon]